MKNVARFLRFAHRNVGVVLSVFVLLLVVTGVLLNHTEDLALHEASAPAWVAKRYYETPDIPAFKAGQHFYYTIGETLHRDDAIVGQCGELQGAVAMRQEVVLLCEEALLLYTPDGQLIEKLTSVPEGILHIGVAGEALVLDQGPDTVTFDPVTLASEPLSEAYVRSEAISLPESLLLSEAVSWEQFLLDLHSGQFLGNGGVWLMDFAAVLIGLLALSGIYMYLAPRFNNRR